MPERVAFVTYIALPDGTHDDRLAIECLRDNGVQVETAVWSSPIVDWTAFGSIVIRSCWDYHKRPDEFTRWVRRLAADGAPLWNPADVILWNMDKRYLVELGEKGIPTPATTWLKKGSRDNLEAVMRENGWDRAVVKPTISASADRTWLVSTENARTRQHELDGMLAEGGVMIQRFVEEISTQGEWSFVFFNGHYSHSVLKQPGAGDFRVQEEFGGTLSETVPDTSLVEQAKAIMAAVDAPTLYTRVDAVDVGGILTLMELELIEPYLFLAEGNAANRFASAIMSTLK